MSLDLAEVDHRSDWAYLSVICGHVEFCHPTVARWADRNHGGGAAGSLEERSQSAKPEPELPSARVDMESGINRVAHDIGVAVVGTVAILTSHFGKRCADTTS